MTANTDIPVATCPPGAPIWVSSTNKVLPAEMTESKTREGNTHDTPGPSYSVRKLECAKKQIKNRMKQKLHNNPSVSEEHRNQL